MNHGKLNAAPWSIDVPLKAGMVVTFQNGFYQSLKGRNVAEPFENSDFVYLGEVDRFGTLARRNAANLSTQDVSDWITKLNIYTIPEVDELLTKKADLVDGIVPSHQLPSYVDDVIDGYYKEADGKFYEEITFETQILGESGKIYLDLGTDSTFRWNGTLFVKIGGGGGGNIQIGLAVEESGTNGYTIVNEQLSILGFYDEEFEYAFTEDPANPGLNIPTISLKNKYLKEPSLANLNIPFWNLTTKSFNNSTLQYDGMTVEVGPLQNLPGVAFAVNGVNKGSMPVPRMTQAQRLAIPNLTSIQAGMAVFQTDGASGYYYWNGLNWVKSLQNISNSNLIWDSNTIQDLNTKKLSFTGGRVSVPALELEITAENGTPNKIWTAGTYLWHTNNLGASYRVAYDNQVIKTISGDVTLDDTYHNCIVRITANCMITVPNTLRVDFNCVFDVIGLFTAQFIAGGTATFSAPFGLYLRDNMMCTLYKETSVRFRVNGGLVAT